MRVAIFAGLIGAAMLLSGCDNNKEPVTTQAPVVQQQPQVVVVQQEPQVVYSDSGSHIGSHLAAGALGYMIGRHGSGSSYRRSEVHHYYHSTPSRRSYGSRRHR